MNRSCSTSRVRRISFVVAAVMLITAGYWLLNTTRSDVRAQTMLGDPIPNLTSTEMTIFGGGFQSFIHIWDPQQGLGPVFTQDACSDCHSSPVTGGNSTKMSTFFGTITNGTFDPLTNEGGMFLQPKSNQIFKPNCILKGEKVPADATIIAVHQPPQLFGMGLLDNIPDAQIMANAVDKGMGVHGMANMVLDQNNKLKIGRFGLKAQFATLEQIAASALQHDIGVTNPLFPTEDLPSGKPIPPNCSISKQPNDDGTMMLDGYHYVLYLAPNTPGAGNTNGQTQFNTVGCNLCHIPPVSPTKGAFTTKATVIVPLIFKGSTLESKALEQQPVNPYSDLLLHDMGPGLQDGLPLGLATGSMFRTTPLWGLSSRVTNGNGLLHDGRAKTVMDAILQHGGEASQVITKFSALSTQDQTDLIDFISSL
ncbi:MAG TPA: di-heme oxidoredictase family protein [Terriglobales bacterium]|nr:di-heme oxidoredictase family protein [Terriglobales bacterium]